MKRRLHYAVLLVLIVSAIGFLPGCADLKEVDQISIMLAVGIDETEDHRVLVSGQIADASASRSSGKQSGSKGKQAFIVHSEYGDTVEDALSKFDEHIARKTFFAHNAVVVFGKTYAQHGIHRALDYLERDRDFRRNELLAVTSDSAINVLRAPSGSETLGAIALVSLVQHGTEKSATIRSTQLVFMRQYLSPSHAPLLARVDVGSDGQLEENGLGLFDGGRLVDCLSPSEANALLLFLGKTQQNTIAVPCGKSKNTDIGMTVRILSSQTKIKPVVRGNRLGFNVRVRGQAEIERACPDYQASPETYRHVEAKVQHSIETRMRSILTRVKGDDVDATQLGTVLFRANPALWRRIAHKWDEMYPGTFVNLDVKIQIYRSGLTWNAPDVEYTREELAPHAGRDQRVQ